MNVQLLHHEPYDSPPNAKTNMTLPNFIVIGAARSGTTSLCLLLGAHPDVYVSVPKEPEFFCRDSNYERGIGWYERYFEGARESLAVGEGSTSYTKKVLFPKTAARVAKHLPNVRLIYLVRHPLRRVESHWMYCRAKGFIPPVSFAEALDRWPHLLDTSLYWKQISAYLDHFSDDQLLICFTRELQSDPFDVLERCFSHIDVNPDRTPDLDPRKENASVGTSRDRPAVAKLRHALGLDADRVQALVQRIPPAWRPAVRQLRQQLESAIPSSIHRLYSKLLKEPVQNRPSWDKETLERAVAEIEDDARKFLTFFGKSPDYWTLSEVDERTNA